MSTKKKNPVVQAADEKVRAAGVAVADLVTARENGAVAILQKVRAARSALTDGGEKETSDRELSARIHTAALTARATALGIPVESMGAVRGLTVSAVRVYTSADTLLSTVNAPINKLTAGAAYRAVNSGAAVAVKKAVSGIAEWKTATPAKRAENFSALVAQEIAKTKKKSTATKAAPVVTTQVGAEGSAGDENGAGADTPGNVDTLTPARILVWLDKALRAADTLPGTDRALALGMIEKAADRLRVADSALASV
jgi:hypothetical protein